MPAEVEMKFAWIPPGTFQMGSTEDAVEKPVHEVIISKGFYLGVFPVTQAQWAWVMGSDNRPSGFQGEDLPVEQVDWDDCRAFCDRLRQQTGKPIRLPSEAEWEYACRAGTTSDFYTGNGDETLDRAGWYGDNSDSQSHPVGQKAPNAFGLYDMHGNVMEWCSDWYGENYYAKSEKTDPQGPNSGMFRVARGGSWYRAAEGCRAACRNKRGLQYCDDDLGLRVCFGVG